MVTSTEPYTYSVDDTLVNAGQIATVVSGTTAFSSGTLRGNSPFVASEMSVADLNDYEVDMTWTCGSGAPAVTRPAGYTFKLSDLGCPATQRMTLRVANVPPRVTVELYGYIGSCFTSSTAPTADGAGFVFHEGGLVVAGAVVSSNAQQAVVKLEAATYDGVAACTPGTYTLPREQ